MAKGRKILISSINKACNLKDNAFNSYIQDIIISKCNQCKNYFTFFCFVTNFEIQCLLTHTSLTFCHTSSHIPSQFRSVTLQVLSSHVGLCSPGPCQLEVWSMGQQRWAHWGTYWKWRFLGPAPELLKGNLQFKEIPRAWCAHWSITCAIL